MDTGAIWEKLGELDAEDGLHVLNQLYAGYEELLERDPESREALAFFERLNAAVQQVCSCNANRR